MFDYGINKKILIGFIVASIIILGVVSLTLVRNSEKFKMAKGYLENSDEVNMTLGRIKSYGFFINSNEREDDTSYLIFKVNGELRSARVKIYFKRDSSNNWMVDSYAISP